MGFRSVNEIHNFDFQDALIKNVKTKDNDYILEIDALIVEPENSQNENFTKSYADIAKITLKDAKILSGVKDGYKHYDANDKLLEEIADASMEASSISTIFNNAKGAYLYAVDLCDESTDDLFVYNFCIEFPSKEAYDTCVTTSYQVKISFKEVVVNWEKYLNKV